MQCMPLACMLASPNFANHNMPTHKPWPDACIPACRFILFLLLHPFVDAFWMHAGAQQDRCCERCLGLGSDAPGSWTPEALGEA